MIKMNFTNSRWGRYAFYVIGLFSFLTTNQMDAQCSLACNTNLQVSVDANCEATFDPTTLLNGEGTSCPGGVFELILKDPFTGEVFYQEALSGTAFPAVDLSPYLFSNVPFTVVDTDSDNSCWGSMFVEDKIGPIINCPTDTLVVSCFDLGPILPPDVTVTENCSHIVDTILLSERVRTNICDNTLPDSILKEVTRIITTVDDFGNQSAQCTLVVRVARVDFDDIVCPPTYHQSANVVEGDLFYDPLNWTEVKPAAGLGTTSGNVNTEITIVGSENGGQTSVCYMVSADNSPIYVTFDWSATSPTDDGDFTGDMPQYSINGAFTVLTTGVADSASGSELVQLSAGDVFCFNVTSDHTTAPDGPEDVTTAIFSNIKVYDNEQPELTCDRGYTWYKDARGNINPTALLSGSFLDVDGDGIPDPVPTRLGGIGVPNIIVNNKLTELYPQNDILCGVFVNYEDAVLPTSHCVTKIVRTWTVREWHCSGEKDTTCIQFIEIHDNKGPVVVVPHSYASSTNGYTCEARVYVAPLTVTDNCSAIDHVDLRYPGGFYRDFPWATGGYIDLPVGLDTIEILSYDDCLNASLDTFTINVADETPPVAICDQHTVVSLTYDGTAHVKANVFDDGSYDDCGLQKMLVRRMTESCDCQDHHPKFDDMTYLGKYDNDGNYHHYYASKRRMTPTKANKFAEAMGGYVTSINTAEEDQWVMDKFSEWFTDEPYWIGYSDAEHEGNFEWSDGSNSTYTNWASATFGGGAITIQEPDNQTLIFDTPPFVPANWTLVLPTGFMLPEMNMLEGRWGDMPDAFEAYYIFELEDPCGFSSYAEFCCEDLETNNNMVVFRVVDKWGNYNDCMIEVEVQDKFPPVIECPPDLTVSCEYNVDLNNLSEFGKVVEGAENREAIVLHGDGLIAPLGQLWDGYAHDNCNVEIMENPPVDERNQCGIGTVIRTWKAFTPGATDTARCWQYIYFPGQEYDVIDFMNMPVDTLIDACGTAADYGPDVTGYPAFDERGCRLIGYTYNDLVYPFNQQGTDACFKIVREWKVIDWCLVENGNNEYPLGHVNNPISHIQIIKVINKEGPRLDDDCDPVSVCTYDPRCHGGYIELEMSATDDCTIKANLSWEYAIDLFNDGNTNAGGSFDIVKIGNGGTAVASDTFPIGDHTIIWTFDDQCGNRVTCAQSFTVKNCKAPTAYCIDGLAVDLMPMDTDGDGTVDLGMVELWASDFDRGSQHPCGYDVILSFSSDITTTNRLFTCSDIGDVSIDIWSTVIIPGGGRNDTIQSFCTTNLNVQDNMNACSGGGATGESEARIAGTVTTAMNETVNGVNVSLVGSEFDPISTGIAGEYAFPMISTGGAYTIMPNKNDGPLNGVSTLDIILIQRHILGLKDLNDPYSMIAADINKDQSISAGDIAELRKLILGINNEFQSNDSWRFVKSSYAFANPYSPLQENFDESHDVASLATNMQIDFTAIKVGDVNNSVDASSNSNSVEGRTYGDNLVFNIEELSMNTGDQVQIPFTAATSESLMGYQFTLEFDANLVEFQGIEAGIININDSNIGLNHLAQGKITFSWANAEAININENDVMFALSFKAIAQTNVKDVLSISSAITSAEAYNTDGTIGVQLDYRNGGSIVGTTFKLYQNTPNPFSETTVIGFELSEATTATISIYNVTGQVIKTITDTYERGYNSVTLSKSDFVGSGILYYTLESNGNNATKRMVVLK